MTLVDQLLLVCCHVASHWHACYSWLHWLLDGGGRGAYMNAVSTLLGHTPTIGRDGVVVAPWKCILIIISCLLRRTIRPPGSDIRAISEWKVDQDDPPQLCRSSSRSTDHGIITDRYRLLQWRRPMLMWPLERRCFGLYAACIDVMMRYCDSAASWDRAALLYRSVRHTECAAKIISKLSTELSAVRYCYKAVLSVQHIVYSSREMLSCTRRQHLFSSTWPNLSIFYLFNGLNSIIASHSLSDC